MENAVCFCCNISSTKGSIRKYHAFVTMVQRPTTKQRIQNSSRLQRNRIVMPETILHNHNHADQMVNTPRKQGSIPVSVKLAKVAIDLHQALCDLAQVVEACQYIVTPTKGMS